ncbi:ATPase PAAT-like isoform X1 [Castor canadensis]|uniref:ATPase PAAT-like isoform X1 n=2 Tax=Castor canadensis TaxID=51338 RepID=A0AC58MXZ4_CASCN
METRTEDVGLTRVPTLTSSWDAECGALTQSLLLARTGVGTQDVDWEELLAPPAPGTCEFELKLESCGIPLILLWQYPSSRKSKGNALTSEASLLYGFCAEMVFVPQGK